MNCRFLTVTLLKVFLVLCIVSLAILDFKDLFWATKPRAVTRFERSDHGSVIRSRCHSHGYITVFDRGQLGNQMSQYATLLAHSKKLGLPAVISGGMASFLGKQFPGISIPIADSRCNWNWTAMGPEEINQLNKDDLKDKNIMIYNFVFDLNAFNMYWHEIVNKEFEFYPGIRLDAESYLRDIAANMTKVPVYVSVHVRRTDYKLWMSVLAKGYLASKEFYSSAMDWFRNKYNKGISEVIFVLATDDPKWSTRMFRDEKDVVFTSEAETRYSSYQPAFDLAVMAQCNHSIISYGTFGFWSAYLKGSGDVILATGTSKNVTFIEQDVSQHLKRWMFLDDPCYFKDENGTIKAWTKCKELL